ncbi:DUF5684 domain-containing protein [Cryobacterium sp. Hb1]|uniref:DUF5684 domain-containing protein n=1 Tax=Cryobacterium sp. Hb1 TaxID=1259147 RepID=UPI00106D3BD4|nr:DUF5684 domain-containing protein [Cryobacterium sp. Hb1]TFD71909.1 FHA domain-containing protein [Cryobacterium sp. Hb1]
MITIIAVAVLVSLGVYVFSSIGLGKVFVKLGEQAWKGWLPIINSITLYELGRYSALWVVGLFIPVANVVALVVLVLAVNNVNRRLGRGGGFTLLYLVSSPIWACVLGFGKSVDTGWMPGIPATGYVPFAPVTPLSMPPAPPAAPAPAGHHVLTPRPPAPPASPAPPNVPAQLAVALLPPAPPAAFPATTAAAPLAPAVPHGLPSGPPPFYVSVPPAPAPTPASPVLSAPAVVPAPPVVAAPPAPSVVSAPPAPPALSVISAPVAAPVNPWAPPAPIVQASTAPFAAVPRESLAAELPIALPGELAAAAALMAARAVAAPVQVPAPASAPASAPVPAPFPPVFPVAVAAQVSAVIPRAAHASDVAEDESEDDDETMIVVRRMKPWTLETEHGLKVSLTKPVVLLGRNPARGGAHLDAQLVPLHDPGKTVSKTHARLDFVDGAWGISDLHSTNGVVLIDGGGFENELDAGASAPLTDRFLLGELAARIYLEA